MRSYKENICGVSYELKRFGEQVCCEIFVSVELLYDEDFAECVTALLGVSMESDSKCAKTFLMRESSFIQKTNLDAYKG